MALQYLKLFQPLQLSGTAAKIAAVATAPTTCILMNGRVRAVNSTGASATVTIYVMSAGGTAGASNVLINAKSISPNDYIDSDLPEMAAGDELWAFTGTANAITLHYMDGVVRS